MQVMYSRKFLVQISTPGGDSLWELTWQHVQIISPSLTPDLLKEPVSEQESKADPEESATGEPGTEVGTAATLPSGDQGTEEHESSEERQ